MVEWLVVKRRICHVYRGWIWSETWAQWMEYGNDVIRIIDGTIFSSLRIYTATSCHSWNSWNFRECHTWTVPMKEIKKKRQGLYVIFQRERVVPTSWLSALQADSAWSSHPISVQVHRPEEIDDIFDTISYQKVTREHQSHIRTVSGFFIVPLWVRCTRFFLN